MCNVNAGFVVASSTVGTVIANALRTNCIIMRTPFLKKLTVLALGTFALSTTTQAVSTADIVFVVDESGSMSGEHTWIANMVASLDTQLGASGVTGNRYALVGFGASSSHGIAGHGHTVGGGTWGTAGQLATAAGGLVISGATEDGYSGINFGLGLDFRSDAAVNFILITDEDRDVFNSSLTYASILSGLQGKNALLNAVVNANFDPGVTLGHDSEGNAYQANGSGGYNIVPATTVTGVGNTETTYIDLALATGGAAWDLNQLRAGGLTAQSFTDAFVDIKVQEIIVQIPTDPNTVPDAGATAGLLGLGVAGLALARRKLS